MSEIGGALVSVLIFGVPAFAIASFIGGFAGAIAAGGRENRSLVQNAMIGFLAWLIANALVGEWGEEPTPRLLALTFVTAVIIAWVDDRRKSRRDSEPARPV